MGEADVRSAAGQVVAALAAAGRSGETIRHYRMVLDRFAVFVAGRGLAAVNEQVCLDFLAEQTGVRLTSLSDPVVGEKTVQAVRRPLVLVADALAGRAVDAGRLVVPPHDGCPARFRALRDEYLVSCRARGNAEATVATKDRTASGFLAYLDGEGALDMSGLGVRELPGFSCLKVFVKHRYPFDTFGTAGSVGDRLACHAARAGIEFAPGKACGMHSLRGALAVAMIGNDTPMPVVSAVLGHASTDTTQEYYLRFDTERLRHCALDVEDVLDGRVGVMGEGTLAGLAAGLVAVRRAGGYRFKVPERVLGQFTGHCAREGYADGSITKEAVDGFLYGAHLRASTVRRNELVLRQLAEYAQAHGWAAYIPPAVTTVRVRHAPPYVLTDNEITRLFTAIDTQAMSGYSNKALADPVLFRVLYGTGLRISEALHLTLADAGTSTGTLRIRDSKNGESRTVAITTRLCSAVAACIAAAHPDPQPGGYLFYTRSPGSPISQPVIYVRFRGYLADADIPHFAGGPHPHSLRHGFAAASLRRWAAAGADLAVMLPYLACYMGHADLRGTQYYLRLTADAYPDVIAKAQVRFGYVIPALAKDQP